MKQMSHVNKRYLGRGRLPYCNLMQYDDIYGQMNEMGDGFINIQNQLAANYDYCQG